MFTVNGVGFSGTGLLVKRFSLGGSLLTSCSLGLSCAKDALDEFKHLIISGRKESPASNSLILSIVYK